GRRLWVSGPAQSAIQTNRRSLRQDETVTNNPSAPQRLWEEWAGITRFLESPRLAFARETSLWNGLELDTPRDEVRISVNAGKEDVRGAWAATRDTERAHSL